MSIYYEAHGYAVLSILQLILSSPDIFLSIMLSKTHTLYSFLGVSGQVSQPYKTTEL